MTETTHLPFGFIRGDDSNSHLKHLRSELAGLEIQLDQLDGERYTLQAKRDELEAQVERLEREAETMTGVVDSCENARTLRQSFARKTLGGALSCESSLSGDMGGGLERESAWYARAQRARAAPKKSSFSPLS
jgi:hypothetical protein